MARRNKRVKAEDDGPFGELLWGLQWMSEEDREDVIDRAVCNDLSPTTGEGSACNTG
jgi:hypothetical protein